jgi:long-subunit fatty acid transport protein
LSWLVPDNNVNWTRVVGFHVLSFLVVTLLLLPVATVAAVEPLTDPTAAEQLKQLNDQTIIGTHVSLDSEWNQFKHGAEKATWTLAGLWGWPASDFQDWGIRFTVPFGYRRSDETSDHTGVGGLGDIEIGTGTAFRFNDSWRTGGGLEFACRYRFRWRPC